MVIVYLKFSPYNNIVTV